MFFANRPTCYTCLEAMTGTKWNREWVLSTCLFVSPLYREDLSKKHMLLLTRQDVLSSATCTFQSVNPSHSPTQTDKISFSQGNMPSTEKKKKVNRPDLLGSKLEQRIMGALTPLAFWEGTSQSPVLSLSQFELWPHALSCLQTKKTC